MIGALIASVLVSPAGSVRADAAPSQSSTGDHAPKNGGDEIIVTGRKGGEAFRLAPQFRRTPANPSDHWRNRMEGVDPAKRLGREVVHFGPIAW